MNIDVIISIRSVLFVVEAQSMHKLVLDNRLPNAMTPIACIRIGWTQIQILRFHVIELFMVFKISIELSALAEIEFENLPW